MSIEGAGAETALQTTAAVGGSPLGLLLPPGWVGLLCATWAGMARLQCGGELAVVPGHLNGICEASQVFVGAECSHLTSWGQPGPHRVLSSKPDGWRGRGPSGQSEMRPE